MKRSRAWLPLLIVFGVGLTLGGAGLWLQRPVPAKTVRVGYGEAVDLVYATGFVEPEQPVEVSSRVTAPVIEVLVREGDRVARGQPLVRLDAGEQRASIAQLAAQTANATAAERRALFLYGRGFLSTAARDDAVATARAARAAEMAARERLGQYEVRAGIAGVVLRKDVEPGDLATPTKTLLTLGDPSLLRVTATVDERDIPRVAPGQHVVMSSDAYPGKTFGGTVRELTLGGDPTQRAFRVRIRPDTGRTFPVGLTLEINIVDQQKAHALLAPARAVRNGAIWIVEDGRARKRPVRTGIEGGDRVEILHGVNAGACVLAAPTDAIKDGARVRAEGC